MTITTPTTRRALAAVAAFAVAGVALTGCVRLPSAAPLVTTEHEVSDEVHALRLENSGDVVVKLGDEPGLTVRAPESVVDRLTVEEQDGTLVLGIDGASLGEGRIRYTLTVRSFDELELEGAGDVRADFSAADTVRIRVDGSGDVRADDVDADEVSVEIEGSGDVRLDGRAADADYRVQGSGDIDAHELRLVDAVAEVGGSGDIALFATGSVRARIGGSGDIRVSGGASVTSEVSGSGDVIQL
ncbi:head GIN domain-containing protein [Protaetiibacter intestinalis]|uniref:DUF2807 domain-containing protein n=1 Tax=Protaetiibacter intestinalis TaxID=2419774 RepID=A0A387B9I1_9MICO|nr:head GIN domain-containing protein [Protaetiibacter intestinalis]AYF97589.1 DUF2807 domain-containing protein [Protaetiibacter intestinalis]